MKCDIILPVCDQYEFTKKCIESIIEKTDTPFRLIIINNGTNPDTRKLLDELERNRNVETTIVHQGHNIGWVKALNKGIELSRAPYICFQNDDTVVTRGWLRKMIETLKLREDFGLINPEWEKRPAGVSVDAYNSMLEKNRKKFIETDWCRGFSVVIKRAVVEKIGKVDEIYGLAYFDDVDYSVQAIESGFLALKALDTYVYHHKNVTFFEILKGEKWNELHEKNKLVYYRKWGRPLRVVAILDRKLYKDKKALDRVEDAVFYLARKQHHVDVFCPAGVPADRFQHTNVRLKVYPGPFMWFLAVLDLCQNARKKPEKRYSAAFSYDTAFGGAISRNEFLRELAIYSGVESEDFNSVVKQTVDEMKEATKRLP